MFGFDGHFVVHHPTDQFRISNEVDANLLASQRRQRSAQLFISSLGNWPRGGDCRRPRRPLGRAAPGRHPRRHRRRAPGGACRLPLLHVVLPRRLVRARVPGRHIVRRGQRRGDGAVGHDNDRLRHGRYPPGPADRARGRAGRRPGSGRPEGSLGGGHHRARRRRHRRGSLGVRCPGRQRHALRLGCLRALVLRRGRDDEGRGRVAAPLQRLSRGRHRRHLLQHRGGQGGPPGSAGTGHPRPAADGRPRRRLRPPPPAGLDRRGHPRRAHRRRPAPEL